MSALQLTTFLVVTIVRSFAGLIGFIFLLVIEFIDCVFKIAFSVEKSPQNEAQKQHSPPAALSLIHAGEQGGQISAFDGQLAIEADSGIALAHFQMYNGVIKDSMTRIIQLSLYGGSNPRIERVLRIPAEKLDFQRINWRFDRVALPPFTKEVADKAGLQFNFEGAKAFSMGDFNSKAIEKVQVGKVNSFSEIATLFKPQAQKVSQPADTQDNTSGNASSVLSEATGRVLSANSVMVTPEGKAPYKSFAVVVKTATDEVSFQGVDLEEKFKKYCYSVNDVISIKRSKAEFDFTKPNGKTEKRSKNTFEIAVIEKAIAQ